MYVMTHRGVESARKIDGTLHFEIIIFFTTHARLNTVGYVEYD